MFSNDDALAQKLSSVGQDTNEKVWRFPLHEDATSSSGQTSPT